MLAALMLLNMLYVSQPVLDGTGPLPLIRLINALHEQNSIASCRELLEDEKIIRKRSPDEPGYKPRRQFLKGLNAKYVRVGVSDYEEDENSEACQSAYIYLAGYRTGGQKKKSESAINEDFQTLSRALGSNYSIAIDDELTQVGQMLDEEHEVYLLRSKAVGQKTEIQLHKTIVRCLTGAYISVTIYKR